MLSDILCCLTAKAQPKANLRTNRPAHLPAVSFEVIACGYDVAMIPGEAASRQRKQHATSYHSTPDDSKVVPAKIPKAMNSVSNRDGAGVVPCIIYHIL